MAEGLEVLETIDALYRAATEPSLWPGALQQFALATGGIGTAMIPITPHNISGLIVSPALAEANVEYEREWWRHDTRVARIFNRRLKSGVCCEAELFTDEELARDPLRQEFLRSYGIGAFAAQLVAPVPGFVVAFSVQRSLGGGHFEKRQIETLGLLGRHAARALFVSNQLAIGEDFGAALELAMDRFDCGVLQLDSGLRLLHLNRAAEAMIGDGLSLRDGALSATHRDHRVPLQKFLRSALLATAKPEADAVALPRPSGKLPLIVQAVPVSPASPAWALPGSAALLILVADLDLAQRPSAALELRRLGLTPSEARLAELLGSGLTRAEAADALGISPSTASDSAKAIYSKLGISRQSALVSLVARLSALSRSPSSAHRAGAA